MNMKTIVNVIATVACVSVMSTSAYAQSAGGKGGRGGGGEVSGGEGRILLNSTYRKRYPKPSKDNCGCRVAVVEDYNGNVRQRACNKPQFHNDRVIKFICYNDR